MFFEVLESGEVHGISQVLHGISNAEARASYLRKIRSVAQDAREGTVAEYARSSLPNAASAFSVFDTSRG